MCPGDLNSTTNSVKWETGRINYQITEFPVIIISWPVPQACLRRTRRKDKDTREGEGRSNTGVVQVAAAFQTHTHSHVNTYAGADKHTHTSGLSVFFASVGSRCVRARACMWQPVTLQAAWINMAACAAPALCSLLQSALKTTVKTVDSSVIQDIWDTSVLYLQDLSIAVIYSSWVLNRGCEGALSTEIRNMLL